MSSTYSSQHGDHSDRRMAQTPPTSVDSTPSHEEPSIRPMRLKVLYTFDDQNKTNCLARWPQILNIRTAHLDEATQIGVIELKTCIEAVLAASPELIAKFGQDYTVYAYDYSEYDTPLVGQGMLSWVLASTSSTPSAPAHQSKTMVTGRVCKNVLGLFGGNIQETLEVKLRLVPVPTCLQSEYLANLKKYRELGQGVPEGFDTHSWIEYLKANPGIAPRGEQGSHSPSSNSGQHPVGIEHVQRLMSEDYGPQNTGSRPIQRRNSNYAASMTSGQETVRSGSPTPSLQSTFMQQPPSEYIRTLSRASSRTGAGPAWSQNDSPPDTTYLNNDDRQDDGPTRKRAKIMKADHPGKAALGKKKDPLRVTASTAASIRVLQPTAVRPAGNPAQSLEAPPRVPTPVPQGTNLWRRPQLPKARSSLGQESVLTSESGYVSPYSMSEDMANRQSSVATSPELCRAPSMSNSPEDPASSPPVLRTKSVAPSSPILPALPQTYDPGFLSGDLDDLFGDFEDEEEQMPNQGHAGMLHQREIQFVMDTTAKEPELPPPPQKPTLGDAEREKAEEAKRRSFSNARKAIGLKRSQTWAGNEPSSDAPKPKRPSVARAESTQPKKRATTVWNKEKRKAAIEMKLNSSIEAGTLPPFCENCGAIETPTWRKAYSKIYSGDHSHVDVSQQGEGVVAIQILETNEDGSTKLFKIFKKAKNDADETFADVLLCNPCGIWLSNRKSMRPESHWKKKTKVIDKAKESRARRAGSRVTGSEYGGMTSDAVYAPSEAMSEASMAPFVFDGPVEQVNDSTGHDEGDQPELPPLRKERPLSSQGPATKHSRSENDMAPSAITALQRAIQSSPARFLGSKQSPIEVDKQSPNPARRRLFSSPKTPGPLGTSASDKGNTGTSKRPSTFNDKLCMKASSTTEPADKENVPPRPSSRNSLDDLFSDFPPLTPSRSDADWRTLLLKSPAALMKTPGVACVTPQRRSLNTGDFFSSAAKAFLHAPPKTPNRTPTKQNGSQPRSGSCELTPFSRHLQQLVSNSVNATMLSPSKNGSPSSFFSDLGKLSSLPRLSPGGADGDVPNLNDGGTPSRMFRSADFELGDFPSSDAAALPSSPPAWLRVYDDPTEERAMWDLDFGSSPAKEVAGVGDKGDGKAALRCEDARESEPGGGSPNSADIAEASRDLCPVLPVAA